MKVYHFSSEIILGNFYRHLAIFSGHTAPAPYCYENVILGVKFLRGGFVSATGMQIQMNQRECVNLNYHPNRDIKLFRLSRDKY